MMIEMIGLLLAADSVTQCRDKIYNMPEFGQVCETKEKPSTGGAPDMRCAGGDWLLAQCTHGQHKEAKARKQLLEDVGKLIASGDCPGAKARALSAGDLDLAVKVKSLCE